MAVTLQAAPTTYTSDESEATSHTFSMTVASGTSTVLVVCGCQENAIVAITGITFNGDALTLHDAINATTWGRAEIWRRIAPDVATGNIVITLSGSDAEIAGAYAADGVDQTTPLRTAAKSTADSGTSVSDTVASVGTDDLVLDVLSIDAHGHAAAVGADQTERWDIQIVVKTTGASSTQPGSAGGVMSWTWTLSAPYSHVASAFIAVAGGAAVSLVMPNRRALHALLVR